MKALKISQALSGLTDHEIWQVPLQLVTVFDLSNLLSDEWANPGCATKSFSTGGEKAGTCPISKSKHTLDP